MLAADYLIDIGPKAGSHGGRIVAQGKPDDLLRLDTLTSSYLNGHTKIPIPTEEEKEMEKVAIKGRREIT